MKSNPSQKNIPNGWNQVALADIGVFSKGSGITRDQLTETGHNAIRYGELYTKFNFKIEKIYSHIPTEVIPTATKIKYGDILFAGSGETNEEIGKSAAYLINQDCYAGGDLIIFTPKNADSLFLSYSLNIGEGRKKLTELGQGQSVVHIYKSEIEKLKLHLPPLPEQTRIVAVLETWDKSIEKLAQKIEKKKQIKKGLMQGLLTGETRIKGFSKKWEMVKLSDIGVFSKGSGVTKEELSETGFNVVRYGELYTKHNIQIKKIYSFIPSAVIQNTKKIQYGDILFAGSGETIDEIGKSAAYLLKEDCYAGGDIVIFSPKKANSLFMSYFLNNGNARKKLREIGQGQSVVHIYKSDIEGLKFYIPSEIEQIAIAEILNTADTEITELEKKLNMLKEQKRYLLNQLITGAIRTPVDLV